MYFWVHFCFQVHKVLIPHITSLAYVLLTPLSFLQLNFHKSAREIPLNFTKMPTKSGGPATTLRNATLGIFLSLSSSFLMCWFCAVCFLALSSSSWTRLDCSLEHLPPFSLLHLCHALQLLPRWSAHRQLGIKDWCLTYSYSCIRFQVTEHSLRYFSVFLSKWLCPLGSS